MKNLKYKVRKLAFKLTYDLGVGAVLLGTGAMVFSKGYMVAGVLSVSVGLLMALASSLLKDDEPP